MGVVLMLSCGHAPGVTTSMLALTCAWPRTVLAVDADRHPTQSVLAGYLHNTDAGGRGLSTLVHAHREQRPFDQEVTHNLVTLQAPAQLAELAADGVLRQFLPGFAYPGSAALSQPVWEPLAGAFLAREGDVLCDLGRVGYEGIPAALLDVADAVLVVCRSTLTSLAAVQLYLDLLRTSTDRQQVPLGLLIIGPGHPYDSAEISRQFGLETWAELQWQPAAAAGFSEGAIAPHKSRVASYHRSVLQAARKISARFSPMRRRLVAV